MKFFKYDQRLGLKVPHLIKEWTEYSSSEQMVILSEWELIRGGIPDRIKELELHINRKQAALFNEINFAISCALNSEIAELASIINDLQIWYRASEELTDGRKHH